MCEHERFGAVVRYFQIVTHVREKEKEKKEKKEEKNDRGLEEIDVSL